MLISLESYFRALTQTRRKIIIHRGQKVDTPKNRCTDYPLPYILFANSYLGEQARARVVTLVGMKSRTGVVFLFQSGGGPLVIGRVPFARVA